MTKRLEPIDTSKYKITETGQVLKTTKEENAELRQKLRSNYGMQKRLYLHWQMF